jgi:hypothetical protein
MAKVACPLFPPPPFFRLTPVSACVCSEGSKGLEVSLAYSCIYASLRLGFLLRSFFALLRKTLSGFIVTVDFSLLDCLHKLFKRLAFYCIRLLLRLQNAGNQFLVPAFSVGMGGGKIPHFMQSRLGKPGENILDEFYLVNYGFHEKIYHKQS